jgi:hypothetical protein
MLQIYTSILDPARDRIPLDDRTNLEVIHERSLGPGAGPEQVRQRVLSLGGRAQIWYKIMDLRYYDSSE